MNYQISYSLDHDKYPKWGSRTHNRIDSQNDVAKMIRQQVPMWIIDNYSKIPLCLEDMHQNNIKSLTTCL